ncbi:MAG: protoheme IX farnesyltransferase [Verrucomicrobia bacterium]|nr:protoheme IX farnesyltransferase [Verrucomicrobiota bacterium]
MINYYLLTKPGIILGNLITVAAGFLLASTAGIDVGLFFATLMGLAFIIASACVFNNFIDREVDKKMERTKKRPLAAGLISGNRAIVFAIFLGIIGNALLLLFTNLLALLVADIGFFIYVLLYSLWKCRTIYGTAIGSIAGATPPVVGYCAVSGRFDLGAILLFAILVLWQMPHFFSIATYRLADYSSAAIPVLPVQKGMKRTKVHMVLYIAAFMVATLMLTLFHYTGYIYLAVTLCLGLAWLLLCLKGFQSTNDTVWGRKMFILSLVIITALCVVIPFDLA